MLTLTVLSFSSFPEYVIVAISGGVVSVQGLPVAEPPAGTYKLPDKVWQPFLSHNFAELSVAPIPFDSVIKMFRLYPYQCCPPYNLKYVLLVTDAVALKLALEVSNF